MLRMEREFFFFSQLMPQLFACFYYLCTKLYRCKLHFIDLELLAEQKNNGGGESTTTLLIERFYRFSCRYRQKVVYLRR